MNAAAAHGRLELPGPWPCANGVANGRGIWIETMKGSPMLPAHFIFSPATMKCLFHIWVFGCMDYWPPVLLCSDLSTISVSFIHMIRIVFFFLIASAAGDS